MEDHEIIALYWVRSEEAILRTAEKYGAYCARIIRRVLGDGRDAEECLSDTCLERHASPEAHTFSALSGAHCPEYGPGPL